MKLLKNLKMPEFFKSKLFKVLAVVFAIFIVLLCVCLVFLFISRGLFSKNEHFVLRYVEVQSPGYWNGRSADVAGKILNLKVGQDNLFGLNLPSIKAILEKEPSIDKASVARVLPETLSIKIVERIPRAFLDNRKSIVVVDENGVVLDRNCCLNIDRNLPFITDYETKVEVKPGLVMPQLKPAIDLIKLTKTDYPDFRIYMVSLKDKEEISFVTFYQEDKQHPYKVYMPSTDIPNKFNVLKSTIIKARRASDPRMVIDLRYEGTAVLN